MQKLMLRSILLVAKIAKKLMFRSKNFANNFFFRKFREVFRRFREVSGELEANGPQNQLGHQILLQIHLS